MVVLELSMAVALSFVCLVTFDSHGTNAVSPDVWESCKSQLTTFGKFIKPDLPHYHYDKEEIPPLHLPECDEPPYAIKNGRIVALFHVRYSLRCDDNHTIPLGSMGEWSCKSAKFVGKKEPEIPHKDFRISECIEKRYPETIYIERGVYVHNSRKCNYGEDKYISEFGELLYKKKTFLVQGLRFVLQFVPELTECTIVISNISYVFQEWVAYLKFRLVHKPIYNKVSKSLLTEGECLLEAAVREIMTENLKTNNDAFFDLDKKDYLFHAGPCAAAGSTIDKEYRNGFDKEVPLCKMCTRGYYLDTQLGSCHACEPNFYVGTAGATKCLSCPTIHAKYKSHRTDSIMDCYDWVTKTNLKAVGRGLVFMITFHLAYVVILTWNIRRYIQVNLIMSGRRVDTLDLSTYV